MMIHNTTEIMRGRTFVLAECLRLQEKFDLIHFNKAFTEAFTSVRRARERNSMEDVVED